MSIDTRHSELFSASDWKLIHQAFRQINFNAYDFDSIRAAMVEYLRVYYPEEFNDWTESDEFVALIDLLAYLGGLMAFRVDLNSQENYLDTAQSRESILRLARSLSYTPRRNYPARGLLKVISLSTDDDIIDSNGRNLNSAEIIWNDAQNPDWSEAWTLILNQALTSTNPFGNPLKTGKVNGVETQLYRFNSVPAIGNLFSFSRTIDGKNRRFEIVNCDFDDMGTYKERMPDPLAAFHLSYRRDGQGMASPNTGFFLYCKQGQLYNELFDIQTPTENRTISLSRDNINEIDLWVQNITDTGFVADGGVWERVQTLDGLQTSNVTFNQLPGTSRNLFSAYTEQNDRVTIRFSDGQFANIPSGRMRVFYRVSDGERYTVRPADMAGVQIIVPYYNGNNIQKNLTLTLALQEVISNSTPPETDEDVKRRATAIYYTQNRMVSGEDYNVFPLQTNLARKLKAMNRIYSGQSRYMDLNDPTGLGNSLNVFADDGTVFKKYDEQYFEVVIRPSIGQTTTEVMDSIIRPFLSDTRMKNFMIDNYLTRPEYHSTAAPYFVVAVAGATQTGTFYRHSDLSLPGVLQKVGLAIPDTEPLLARLITEGAVIKFRQSGWVGVTAIANDGDGIVNGLGKIQFNKPVLNGDVVDVVLPNFRPDLTMAETTRISDAINSRRSFGIGFDSVKQEYYVIEPTNLRYGDYLHTSMRQSNDYSWLLFVQYNSDAFRVMGRGLIYAFESTSKCKFFHYNSYRSFNPRSGQAAQDTIRVLPINPTPAAALAEDWASNRLYAIGDFVKVMKSLYRCTIAHTSGPTFQMFSGTVQQWDIVSPSLGESVDFALSKPYRYQDGHRDGRVVQVSFADTDVNGMPDDPEIFYSITGYPLTYQQTHTYNGTPTVFTYLDENTPQNLFWEKTVGIDGYDTYTPSSVQPLIVRRVYTSWVDVNNPYQESQVILGNVLARSTPLPEIGHADHLPHESIIMLLGQGQFDPTREGENGLYRVTGTVLVPIADDRTVVWDFHTGDFYLKGSPYSRDLTGKYECRFGRNDLKFQWDHVAPKNHRIDPSVTNIIDIYVLTTEYDIAFRNYLKSGGVRPTPPSEQDLRAQFSELEAFKTFSDELVWRPVSYKLLFGQRAEEEVRCKFKVIKIPSTVLSDGEIKSQIIRAMNEFFVASRWDFGETVYWSDLSAYIHLRLQSSVASIVLVPTDAESQFGRLFEIPLAADEIPISAATVDDIEIITHNTAANLRIG